jgi:hypothetical protein
VLSLRPLPLSVTHCCLALCRRPRQPSTKTGHRCGLGSSSLRKKSRSPLSSPKSTMLCCRGPRQQLPCPKGSVCLETSCSSALLIEKDGCWTKIVCSMLFRGSDSCRASGERKLMPEMKYDIVLMTSLKQSGFETEELHHHFHGKGFSNESGGLFAASKV